MKKLQLFLAITLGNMVLAEQTPQELRQKKIQTTIEHLRNSRDIAGLRVYTGLIELAVRGRIATFKHDPATLLRHDRLVKAGVPEADPLLGDIRENDRFQSASNLIAALRGRELVHATQDVLYDDVVDFLKTNKQYQPDLATAHGDHLLWHLLYQLKVNMETARSSEILQKAYREIQYRNG